MIIATFLLFLIHTNAFSRPNKTVNFKGETYIDADFDECMGKNSIEHWALNIGFLDYAKCTYPEHPLLLYKKLKNMYKAYSLSNRYDCHDLSKPKIPKIIHQFWIGSPVPEKYKQWIESWKKHHPEWEHKLWTDKEVKELKLFNQELFNSLDNYGHKVDVLTYEVLYQFGGVYIDIDFECLKPLDIFHYCYDFYTGIQPLDITCLALGHGIIGAKKEHPIIKECMEFQKYNDASQNYEKVGPVAFTKAFYSAIQRYEGPVIAFPSSYFYPLGVKQRFFEDKFKKETIRPESIAIHYWEGSWQNPEAEVKK